MGLIWIVSTFHRFQLALFDYICVLHCYWNLYLIIKLENLTFFLKVDGFNKKTKIELFTLYRRQRVSFKLQQRLHFLFLLDRIIKTTVSSLFIWMEAKTKADNKCSSMRFRAYRSANVIQLEENLLPASPSRFRFTVSLLVRVRTGIIVIPLLSNIQRNKL